jgi:hypothetical protein
MGTDSRIERVGTGSGAANGRWGVRDASLGVMPELRQEGRTAIWYTSGAKGWKGVGVLGDGSGYRSSTHHCLEVRGIPACSQNHGHFRKSRIDKRETTMVITGLYDVMTSVYSAFTTCRTSANALHVLSYLICVICGSPWPGCTLGGFSFCFILFVLILSEQF